MKKLPALAAAGGLLIAASAQTDENQGKQTPSPISVDMNALTLSVDGERLLSLSDEVQAEVLADAIEPMVIAVRNCVANGIRRQGLYPAQNTKWSVVDCGDLKCSWQEITGRESGARIRKTSSARGLSCTKPGADSRIKLAGSSATISVPKPSLRWEKEDGDPTREEGDRITRELQAFELSTSKAADDNGSWIDGARASLWFERPESEWVSTSPHSFGVGNRPFTTAAFTTALKAIELEMTPPPQMPEDPKELRWE